MARNETVPCFPLAENKWINSEPLGKEALHGKMMLIDFFTYCCINCIHMLPFVHELEQSHPAEDGLVVVGVHSAKFPTEKVLFS